MAQKNDITPFEAMSEALGDWRINHIVNVSAKDRYVWFKNPKVASSTLNKSLQLFQMRNLQNKSEGKAHHPPHHSAHIKAYQFRAEEFNSLLTREDFCRFTFVRNPYSRLVSAYEDKIVRNKPQKAKILKRMGFLSKPIETDVSFPEFVEIVCATPALKMDIHWMPQVYLTGQRWFTLDFIGKLETFSEDYAKLSALINPALKSHMTSRTRNQTGSKDTWQARYDDPAVKSMVEEAFADDFAAFGYSTRI